ncbi:dimethyladenosine transferase 1, mitochondrial-like [Schistocerca gregaria]|uniref:dimethyladenosine transferase 1, mitochondrial-like n=1 Tax=Schistocerca gregaria TaxID=7010 RepID=UPI00211EEBB6|nr:dimethyladenosine transferase 1, mitochondrial-like [Schistocerca gregaria]
MLRLPPLPTIAELIKLYGLSAKQQLSQNFLLDLNITDKISKGTGHLKGLSVLEIGPGPGSLTRSILRHNPRAVAVVEKDYRFLSSLRTIQSALPDRKLSIFLDDVLKVDEKAIFDEIGAEKTPWEAKYNPNRIIGNLPFGVATALLIKWVRNCSTKKGPYYYGRIPMVLLFQKEVAMRITAKPKTKEYGRLSIMVQNWFKAKCLFDIDGSSFVPQPKVKATAVYIEPLEKPIVEVNVDTMEYLCRQLFGMRRKLISNSAKALEGIAVDEFLKANRFISELRAEELSVEKWGELALAYEQWKEANPFPCTEKDQKKLVL